MDKKKAANGLLIGLSVLLVAGMAYQFTPNVGQLFNRQQGTPALKVGNQTVTVEELNAARQGNPALASEEGVVGDDAKIFLVSQAIDRAAILGGLGDVQVSRSEIDAEVNKVRESNQLTDNKAWTDALQRAGMTDSGFRKQRREQLAFKKKTDEINAATPAPTDAELRAFYEISRNDPRYLSEAQIVGREIVVTDKAKATALLTQAKGGADFAKLASANSTEYKDRGGALGPIENGQPRPVLRAVLPTKVADAAFGLTSGGLTDVIEDNGKFYIVKVERFIPSQPKTFEQAKTDLTAAVKAQKQNAAVEKWTDGLRQGAKVEYVDPTWKIENPTVASVAGKNIPYSELVTQMFSNQQVAGLLSQVPPEQAADLLNKSFKPGLVEQLIASYAAPNIVQKLSLPLTGPRAQLAQQLLAYGARDVEVTDSEIQKYYRENIQQFETPASANLDEASFKDKNQAAAFRADWNGQGDFVAAASKAGGTVSERGQVTPAPDQTGQVAPLTAAAFGTGLRQVTGGSLTPVIQSGNRYLVGYVRDLVRPTTKPLAEVREEIRTQLLGTKQGEVGQAFIKKEVDALKPKNNLETVLAAQAKRVAAAKPATPPATTTGGSAAPATPENSTGKAPAEEKAPAQTEGTPTETAPANSQ